MSFGSYYALLTKIFLWLNFHLLIIICSKIKILILYIKPETVKKLSFINIIRKRVVIVQRAAIASRELWLFRSGGGIPAVHQFIYSWSIVHFCLKNKYKQTFYSKASKNSELCEFSVIFVQLMEINVLVSCSEV